MPVHRLTPILLCFFPVWRILTVLSHPQHHPCQMIQTTALCNNLRLSSVPSGLPDNIEELQLNYNHIQTLQDDSLLYYPRLSTLSLACSKLEKLHSNTFLASKLLGSLNLADNNLHVGYLESSKALKRLPGLRILDLSENKLDDGMASVLLHNLTSLEYLNLSGNLLLRLDESLFSDLHQLKELDLQRNMLFEIDNAFDRNPKLQRLNLAFNYLPCLIDFHMVQLVVLNASHNVIEWFITSEDINVTFHLETLDLTNNKLLFFPFLPTRSRLRNLYLSHNSVRFYERLEDSATFPNGTTEVQFYNLRNITSNLTVRLWDDSLHGDVSAVEILDLTENQVDYFPEGFLRKMLALSRLQMRTNCLEVLNLTSEQLASSLYELDISNNRLNEVAADKDSLIALGNLTFLNLSLNGLQWLPPRFFSSLPSLRSLDLSFNSINVCQTQKDDAFTDTISECVIWKNAVSLRKLYLKGCKLEIIPPFAFTGMSLTHLELSDNPGLFVEHSLQSLSRTLQHLGFGNTQIQSFDFSSFKKLNSLNISRNLLTHFPSSLSNLDLRLLDVRDNRLWTIPSEQARVLAPKLQAIFLTGNPFNCCQTEWYRTFVTAKTVNMVEQSDIVCEDLIQATHQLQHFTSFICSEEDAESIFWYIMFCVSIAISFICISTISVLMLRHKRFQKPTKKKCLKPTSY